MKFGPLSIRYDERVLEPRPWTLAQSEWAAALAADAPAGALLELCSGAGQIGLAAALLSGREVVLVDANGTACDFAIGNALDAGLGGRVEVRHGPMDRVLESHERFALVLADPPYIPSTDVDGFPEDPLAAIDGGADGLDLARLCLEVGARHLPSGGSLLVQLRDTGQADQLSDELARSVTPLLDPVETRSVDDRGTVLHLVRTGHTSPAESVVS